MARPAGRGRPRLWGSGLADTAGSPPIPRRSREARGLWCRSVSAHGYCGCLERSKSSRCVRVEIGNTMSRLTQCGSPTVYVRTEQIARFAVVAGLAGGLEAFSVQNDNLTLPLYMWAMVVLLDVVDQGRGGT